MKYELHHLVWSGKSHSTTSEVHHVGLGEVLGDLRRATLIDIHTAEEFGGPLGHIAGSINIPIAEISRRLGVPLEIKGPVITIGRVEKRSASAAVLLSNAGFAAGIRLFPDRGSFQACTTTKAHGNPENHLASPSFGRLVWLPRTANRPGVRCRRADILRTIQLFSSSP